MSAIDTPTRSRDRRGLLQPDPATAAGAALALVCTVTGQFVQTPLRPGDDGWSVDVSGGGGFAGLAVLVGFVLVAAVVVSAFARAGRAARHRDRRALGLAVAGAASVFVFWTGLPAILAAAAAGLVLTPRPGGGLTTPAGVVALTLAALTVFSAGYLAVAG
ncbi:hypothetical protein [Geodermatophilus sp. CPCC 206100]|uniref:hypothetical protein n=1 Tax=Geodermatophilus sp. CPCC 206100 TaxID=3020054 RepID=UPI003B004586